LLLSYLPLAHAAEAPVGSAVAASFDCSHAVGIDTDIICSDPLLRQADNDLGHLYRTVLAEAGGQARIDALKSDERQWLMRRNSQCNVSKSLKLNSNQLPGYVDCFLAAYEERIDDLRRMRADPTADPASISNPIRKSSFGDAVPDISIPPGALIETGLVASDSGKHVLGFTADSTLVVLGAAAGQPGISLLRYKPPAPLQTLSSNAPIASGASLCVAGNTILVLPGARGQPILQAHDNQLQPVAALTPQLQRACAISPDRSVVGAPDGTVVLDLGPRVPGASSTSRTVTLDDAAGSHALNPPIRIDRRFPPIAQFDASTGQFIVSPGTGPRDARTIADRTWAKTNCGPFWLVDPASHRATAGCIPFGSYVDETNGAALSPMPTRGGLYFAIANRGLFKVVDGSPKRVVAAPVNQTRVAPDGCTIAFIAAAGKTSAEQRVMLLNACAIP
jgi:uncharacterized protein